ncbi:thiolase family protein [Microlunatus ginsengisoli]|uniref:Probable acetyl-CoA acetyltransferase n=1 Tax=Microlunatus ginsengisoli TaxID=363863 RepID=A0ABP6ZDX4_9ACTN
MSDRPVIVEALRTPIGRQGGALREVRAAELAAPVLAELQGRLARLAPGVHPTAGPRTAGEAACPDEVILGNCMGPGGDVARVAALAAGLPVAVPGLTVDRQCGSGLAAVVVAADQVAARGGIVLAGGVESPSTAPWRYWPPTGDARDQPPTHGTPMRGTPMRDAPMRDAPTRYTRAPFAPDGQPDPEMGEAADALAATYGIGRADQDAYAARSHARAVATAAAGGFDGEIVPVGTLSRDERPSPRLTAERLARLTPAFGPHGTVTTGNSCGINDGAAAVTVVDGHRAETARLPGLEIVATATAGVPTDRPGFGIVPATEQALDHAGLTLDDVEVIEFNEAFAGQVLACCAALRLDPARVCPQGGALALGHPWGASGAVLLVRLFSQLVRTPRPGAYGLAAIAVGGGQGVAMVVRSC